ncbi:MAG: hypothetical protein PW788_05945 [Micavibrio sp.]|nr:hypothetical protein [Micavibrio sp.]
MDVTRILLEIDAEIARLQEARIALISIGGTGTVAAAPARRRGRPKGSTNKPAVAAKAKGKRNLTPEGRKRIAEAMKRRWAEHRSKATKAKSSK